MQYKNIFNLDIKWNYKSITLLAILIFLPNFVGMINIPTAFGFKLHLFQYLIFIAAAIYGPFGGLFAGGFGSLFTAVMLNNPYIIVGNMLLGFFVGLFLKKGINLIIAVLMAYSIQLPWLWLTDVYLASMPISIVNGVVIALFFTNIVWALLAYYSYKPIKKALI